MSNSQSPKKYYIKSFSNLQNSESGTDFKFFYFLFYSFYCYYLFIYLFIFDPRENFNYKYVKINVI
jgi:hypothetical protein